MAYDRDLADRVRAVMGHESGVSEQPMFGGLAFLLDGNIAVHVRGMVGLLVRVGVPESERLHGTDGASIAVMGRTMRGWLDVAADHVTTDDQVATWVARGVAFARSLPAKARR